MALIAGIDGCGASWVCISMDTETRILRGSLLSAQELLPLRWSIAGIDVPIGLPDSRPRAADCEARRFLGRPRASSVFPCPYRAVLGASSWEEMNELTRSVAGRGVSKQSFGILAKVREIDELVRTSAEARRCFVEVHPEVSFAAWAGSPMRHNKKRKSGREERRELIERHFGAGAIAAMVNELKGKKVPFDDLADAFAGLWTADRFLRGLAQTLPSVPEIDSEGLLMRIVY